MSRDIVERMRLKRQRQRERLPSYAEIARMIEQAEASGGLVEILGRRIAQHLVWSFLNVP